MTDAIRISALRNVARPFSKKSYVEELFEI